MIAAAPEAGTAAQAAVQVVARLVPLNPGCYSLRLATLGATATIPGLALPAVHVCAAPQWERAIEIADPSARAESWLSAGRSLLFLTARNGGTALVTGFLARSPNSAPLTLDIGRVDRPGDPPAPLLTLELGGPLAAGDAAPGRVGLDIVVHIRERGDTRFADPPWAGRLGPGLWIEAIAILPRDPAAAAAIEYKGLAASGVETPWLAAGSLCGTRGQGTPLIGFAMRQKAGAGAALFDCEYTGYFSSGATAGPARNGAPCRSAVDGDPLEGLELRITSRPLRLVSRPIG